MSLDIIGAIDGASSFHVNITPDALTSALEPYVVVPTICRRVWAGDDPENPQLTVCLKFNDEAAFQAMFPQPELDV